jgi:altronate hydrolase
MATFHSAQPVIQIDPSDNVATALAPLDAGATVAVGTAAVTLKDAIARGHKFAVREIAAGEPVIKYGQPIGRATAPIAPGQHVHIHNVASARAGGSAAGRPKSQTASSKPS